MKLAARIIGLVLPWLLAHSPAFSFHQEKAEVHACRAHGDSQESCHWHMLGEPKLCNVKSPCSKLVIFFSGAGMSCTDPLLGAGKGIGAALSQYTKDSFVAVCAQLYTSPTTAATTPLHQSTARTDTLVTSITGSPAIRRIWDGKYLLFAGVGDGASALVTTLFSTPHGSSHGWKGSRKTAACLHDTTPSPQEADAFWSGQKKECASVRSRLVCDRYRQGKECPVLKKEGVASADDFAQLPVATLPIHDWKLIGCGAAVRHPPCGAFGQWLPTEPQKQLCGRIDRADAHHCDWSEQPASGHLTCSVQPRSVDACRLWFNNLAIP